VPVQPLPDHRLDQVVADQLARGHGPPHLGGQLGVGLHVPPEDVADADVDQVVVPAQQLRLGALAAALHTHDHVLAHG
jgi:hypothetical protein